MVYFKINQSINIARNKKTVYLFSYFALVKDLNKILEILIGLETIELHKDLLNLIGTHHVIYYIRQNRECNDLKENM